MVEMLEDVDVDEAEECVRRTAAGRWLGDMDGSVANDMLSTVDLGIDECSDASSRDPLSVARGLGSCVCSFSVSGEQARVENGGGDRPGEADCWRAGSRYADTDICAL
jgi:hypothetical protein